MKFIALAIALGAMFFAAILTPVPAAAGLSFEDPQICLNGKLLMIEPTTAPIDVWVRVGPDVTVDLEVVNCGGNPDLPVVDADQVKYDGKKNWVEVAVKTKKHTDVVFYWNGKASVKNSGNDNWVYVKAKVK